MYNKVYVKKVRIIEPTSKELSPDEEHKASKTCEERKELTITRAERKEALSRFERKELIAAEDRKELTNRIERKGLTTREDAKETIPNGRKTVMFREEYKDPLSRFERKELVAHEARKETTREELKELLTRYERKEPTGRVERKEPYSRYECKEPLTRYEGKEVATRYEGKELSTRYEDKQPLSRFERKQPTSLEERKESTLHEDNKQQNTETKQLTPPIPVALGTDTAIGKYVNWNQNYVALTTQPWCCIGDLMAFCDKYEFKALSHSDVNTHNRIVIEVQTLLRGPAPFDMRRRFPNDIHCPENLWVCIGRCAGVEYHLNRILNAFRKPLDKLSPDKQRAARQNFHLAVNELRLDISARISEVRLYDRNVFEREFQLNWQNTME